MNPIVELLPCPFCGGGAHAYDRFNVKCTGCGAEINAQPGQATDLWNKRIPQVEIDGAGAAVATVVRAEEGPFLTVQFAYPGVCHAGQKLYAAPAALPDGYVMVPKEPTEEMLRVGEISAYETDRALPMSRAIAVYKAMIAAAQGGRK